MIGLAADGRLFGLDANIISGAAFTAICIIFLFVLLILIIIFNIAASKAVKQIKEYFRVKYIYYKNHMNNRQD